MNLPQTTIDRIEKEAEHAGRMLCSEWPFNAAKIAYSRGATAEATRALPLYEALKLSKQLLNAYAIRHKDTAQLLLGYTNEEAFAKIDTALASYDSGEPVEEKEQGKEAKEFAEWLDIQRNNGTDYYKDMAIWGKEDAFERMYTIWQQSLKQ